MQRPQSTPGSPKGGRSSTERIQTYRLMVCNFARRPPGTRLPVADCYLVLARTRSTELKKAAQASDRQRSPLRLGRDADPARSGCVWAMMRTPARLLDGIAASCIGTPQLTGEPHLEGDLDVRRIRGLLAFERNSAQPLVSQPTRYLRREGILTIQGGRRQ